MSEIPEGYYFTKEHEWIAKIDGAYRIGISEYAQEELGDVVFVDLPDVGGDVSKGDVVFTVESVKAVSDIYAPVTGAVSSVNEVLSDKPELVNTAPFTEGWMIEVNPSEEDPLSSSDLMDAVAYREYVSTVKK